VGLWDPFDHAVQAEAPQVAGHSALGEVGDCPVSKAKLLSQIAICQTAGKRAEPDQQMRERYSAVKIRP
jgi:hypothetical protein